MAALVSAVAARFGGRRYPAPRTMPSADRWPKSFRTSQAADISMRGRDLAPVELELRQILFASNFIQYSPFVAREAVSLAEEFRARLTLLHVMEDYTELGSRPDLMEDGISD